MIRRDGRDSGEASQVVRQHVSPSDFITDNASNIDGILQKYQSQLMQSISSGVVDHVVEQLKEQIKSLPVQVSGQISGQVSGQATPDQLSEEGLRGIAQAMIKMNKIDGGNIENIGKKQEIKTDQKVNKQTIDLLKNLE
jgi:Rod binding domain-containing protein